VWAFIAAMLVLILNPIINPLCKKREAYFDLKGLKAKGVPEIYFIEA
jgi:hypothetical protein